MRPGVETAIGLDVGGTRMRAARIGRDGTIHAHCAEPVRADRHGFCEQIARLAAALRDGSTIAVGAGLPGRIDARAQTVHSAGYLDIAGLDIAGLLNDATGLPARIENDATMALIAESRMRAIQGLVLMVTIGTGIGGAAVLDGAPWYGGRFAGQFGHIAVAPDGPVCRCGRRGCVETFSSGEALGRLLREGDWPEATRIEDILALSQANDANAISLIQTWTAPLERALQSLTAALDPALIVLGGGLGTAMLAALAQCEQSSRWFEVKVAAAACTDAAGVIGAGLAGLDHVSGS